MKFGLTALLFVYMICFSYLGNAQSLTVSDVNKINELVSKYVHKNYKPDTAVLTNFCEAGFLLVKFQVDPTGQISGLSFSKKAPLFIQNALTTAIASITTDIYLVNAMKRSGKTFILPFQYSYQLGCHFDQIPPGKDYYKTYFDKWTDMEHYDDRQRQAMEMTDGTFYGLDCVLLSVYSTGAMAGY